MALNPWMFIIMTNKTYVRLALCQATLMSVAFYAKWKVATKNLCDITLRMYHYCQRDLMPNDHHAKRVLCQMTFPTGPSDTYHITSNYFMPFEIATLQKYMLSISVYLKRLGSKETKYDPFENRATCSSVTSSVHITFLTTQPHRTSRKSYVVT